MGLKGLLVETIRLVFCALLITAVFSQEGPDAHKKTIEDWIPLLADNDDYEPVSWRKWIGGQNFTWCCTKAVADSLAIDENGNLTLSDDAPTINLNVTALQAASDQGQFSCTANYDEDHASGSPEITVNYTWLADNCPGWQLNDSENLNGAC